MTLALGTLTFLTLLWAIVVIGAMVLEQSGGKIVAALKGETAPMPLQTAKVRIRSRQRNAAPVRATPRMRAAA